MQIVVNKDRLNAVAQDIGIATPVTRQIRSLQELDDQLHELTYPVVLKWANPHEVGQMLSAQGLELEKTRYCYNDSELRSTLARYESIGRYPLIQSFAPGWGLGQMLFMHNGEALLRFQHERIHEWPPEGGVSSLCRSVPIEQHTDLMHKSIRLLQEIGWEGAAMVEYRYDSGSGRAILMEVNGRFWGSLPLAYRAGAPFAWYTYSVLGKKQQPEPRAYREGLRCVFMIPEVKRLYRILFRPQLIENKALRFNRAAECLAFLGNLLDPMLTHYVFKWSDPLPAISDFYFGLRNAVTRR
jgi:predicted ATP-grasp superfamily ATP-dependent carboligase